MKIILIPIEFFSHANKEFEIPYQFYAFSKRKNCNDLEFQFYRIRILIQFQFYSTKRTLYEIKLFTVD